ncbi:MAG: sigma-70 family RNA polymerase sigma factor [Bacteroidota bacterium]
MTTHPDAIYIDALCKNDRLKVLELYQKCFPSVEQYIKRNNGSLSQAKDVFQEVLLELYERACIRQEFTLTTTICSFLGYVSKMKWLKILSKKKPVELLRQEVEETYKDDTLSIEAQIIRQESQAEEQKKLTQSFAQLSERCKELLELKARGLSTEEIIEQMNFSNRNVLDASTSRCFKKWRELYQSLD